MNAKPGRLPQSFAVQHIEIKPVSAHMNGMMDFDNHPHSADLARLRKLAVAMDSAYKIPGTSVRLGWDAILGLVPVVGDLLTLAPSVFILRESHRMGAPSHLLVRMGLNTGVDVVLGAIPLVGDLFDIGWQSKTRNVNLLHKPITSTSSGGYWLISGSRARLTHGQLWRVMQPKDEAGTIDHTASTELMFSDCEELKDDHPCGPGNDANPVPDCNR